VLEVASRVVLKKFQDEGKHKTTATTQQYLGSNLGDEYKIMAI
jgi:hypothetical protein